MYGYPRYCGISVMDTIIQNVEDIGITRVQTLEKRDWGIAIRFNSKWGTGWIDFYKKDASRGEAILFIDNQEEDPYVVSYTPCTLINLMGVLYDSHI